MIRKSIVFVTLLIIIAGILTLACTPPPPASCSPGFWKNRGYDLFGPYDTTDLHAKGPGSGAIRHARADQLNSKFPNADMYCND